MKRVVFTAILAAAPGQTGSNPGQTFNGQRETNPDALSPGQQFKQDRVLISPDTPAPGQGVINWGNTKP
jgi:hypothetical protein